MIPPVALNTPLVRLPMPDDTREVWLKLENLSPIGSFKLRGVYPALEEARLGGGPIWTVSMGNFGRAVAWAARRSGTTATVLIPQEAPVVKEAALAALGAAVERVALDELYACMEAGGDPARTGCYVDPVAFSAEVAGYGTIGLELAERLDDIDTVYAPWGGGALACGIAAALSAVQPRASVVACEPETGAALTRSRAAGHPVEVDWTPSFVDAAGGRRVFPRAWELAEGLVSETAVVTLDEAAGAIRYLAEHAKVIAEGAGALAVAVALRPKTRGRTVCIVSGGNIDLPVLQRILGGETPPARGG